MPQFPAYIDLSTLNGTTGFRLSGSSDIDQSGFSVASAGDVNGDGFDDVIVGAPNAEGSPTAGIGYVVFGKAGGFAPNIDLSDLDGSNGFKLPLHGYTMSVASAGDVNGDGFDAVIVGAPYADPNGPFSGASYVVFGKAAGFAPDITLSSIDGSTGFRISGAAAGDNSGWSVASRRAGRT